MDFFPRLIRALTELHPLHPMLVHFPIALTAVALFFILLALWKKNLVFEQMAFANISLAAVGTLLAGLTGMYDNNLNYGGDAPNASLKIILAITLLVITTTTALLRRRNPDLFTRKSTKVLYVAAYPISFLLAFTLAFLGGVILYGF